MAAGHPLERSQGAKTSHGELPQHHSYNRSASMNQTQPSAFDHTHSEQSIPQAGDGVQHTASFPYEGRKRQTLLLEEGLPSIMRPKHSGATMSTGYRRLLEKRLSVKNKLILFICEFVGTTLFLFFAYGIATQASDKIASEDPSGPPDTSALLFSSLGFGFSLAVNAWVWFRVTGSLFNPALTLGLTLLGNLDWLDCITLTVSQFCGAIAAAGLTAGLLPGMVNARTTLHGGTTINQGFWIEFFATSMLLFTVYMLAGEKHKATFLAPVGIGLALFLGELLATKYTGGSLNPARSLGPDVVLRKFDGFAWIYYIAPYLATLFTTAFYKGLVWANYWTIVPDMDADANAEKKQVIRDIYGNTIGALDLVAADAFNFAADPAGPATVNADGQPTSQDQQTMAGTEKMDQWKVEQDYQQTSGATIAGHTGPGVTFGSRSPTLTQTGALPSGIPRGHPTAETDDTYVGSQRSKPRVV